jgi:hypothetical protein
MSLGTHLPEERVVQEVDGFHSVSGILLEQRLNEVTDLGRCCLRPC